MNDASIRTNSPSRKLNCISGKSYQNTSCYPEKQTTKALRPNLPRRNLPRLRQENILLRALGGSDLRVLVFSVVSAKIACWEECVREERALVDDRERNGEARAFPFEPNGSAALRARHGRNGELLDGRRQGFGSHRQFDEIISWHIERVPLPRLLIDDQRPLLVGWHRVERVAARGEFEIAEL